MSEHMTLNQIIKALEERIELLDLHGSNNEVNELRRVLSPLTAFRTAVEARRNDYARGAGQSSPTMLRAYKELADEFTAILGEPAQGEEQTP